MEQMACRTLEKRRICASRSTDFTDGTDDRNCIGVIGGCPAQFVQGKARRASPMSLASARAPGGRTASLRRIYDYGERRRR